MDEAQHRELSRIVIRHGAVGAGVGVVGLALLLVPVGSVQEGAPDLTRQVWWLACGLAGLAGLLLALVAVVRKILLDRAFAHERAP